MSVFAGGWTLADADAVIGTDTSLGLQSLLDSSLVRRRGTPEVPRFVLLETIRAYAGERLRALGEEGGLHARHALHFAEVAERAWQHILSGGDGEAGAYVLLDAEHDNIRSALASAAETGDVELEARIAAAMRWFWLVQGHLVEGSRVFARLIAKTEDDRDLHAQALALGSSFSWRLGDLVEARARLEEGLALYRELGNEEEIARCVAELGGVAVTEGDLGLAHSLYEETVVLFERLGNRSRLATALANLAAIAAQADDAAAAVAYGERAVAIQREIEELDGLAVSLANVTRVRLALGDDDAARRDLRESIEIARRIGYQMLLGYTVGAAAELAARTGEAERAARLVGACAGAFDAIGMPLPSEEAAEHERTLAAIRPVLGVAAVDALVAEGRAAPFDEMVEEALASTR
jgi:tetratricopeptide (TPR) repeat protein